MRPSVRKLTYPWRSGAGAYEQEQYETGLQAWRRRVLPRIRWLLFPIFFAGLIYAVVGPATKVQFLAGLLAGGAFSVYLWVRDEPPEHIRRHGRGAAGERATARVLGPLRKEGWRLAHNIDTGRGNRDHVIVGPGGIYLLDSKHFGGTVTVERDTVHVERVDSPADSYNLPKLAGILRGEAWKLHDEIVAATGLQGLWVTAVVVFWSPFSARLVEGDRIVFVHGDELAGWLRNRPHRMSNDMVAGVAGYVG